ncbi:MAG: VWA domain-containing protein [Acidimicrobiales bacterium]
MEETLAGDLDEGVSLLRDLARATDPALRSRARQLAASLLIPATRTPGPSRPGGSARIGTLRKHGVDLDIDATLERLVDKNTLTEDDLRWRGWLRPGRSVVVVVDASGSVTGRPLETAVVTAAALAGRLDTADELAVVAFWSKVLVLRHLGEVSPPATVIERLLALRSGDTTDLAGGITAGLAELASARTARKDVIVITDGIANEGGDPAVAAESARSCGARLHVLALPGDDESASACEKLAEAGGGLLARLERPGQAVSAVAAVLGDGW